MGQNDGCFNNSRNELFSGRPIEPVGSPFFVVAFVLHV